MRVRPWRFHTRWLWAMPNMVILLFLAAVIGFVVLFRLNEYRSRQESLIEDVLWQEQALRLQVQGQQNQLADLTKATVSEYISQPVFLARSQFLQNDNPELTGIIWLDRAHHAVWSSPPSSHRLQNGWLQTPEVQEGLRRARLMARPVYSPPLVQANQDALIFLVIPAYQGTKPAGTMIAAFSLKTILKQHVPWWIARKHQISIETISGKLLAARFDQSLPPSDITHDLELEPFGDGIRLRATSYQTSTPQLQNTLLIVVSALAMIMLWSLWTLKRHMQQRREAELALRQEMGMRRAMEDSMVSGMRAMDMNGNIIYVNRAFCNMVGMPAEELIGHHAPMPYWPPEEDEACRAVYKDVLVHQNPSKTGYTLRFMRKNGERFDVRVYYSPLIDGQGKQTGWMGSLYDITELKREREALSASQERFVTVLNGLDTAVSVVDTESRQLLFTNHNFRTRFLLTESETPLCVIPLLPAQGQHQETQEGEFWDAINQRWYHIQRRQTIWVDGRAVWLEIATDITDTRLASERERQHAERLQHSSRLISMGEMASSLAHELNQPLAAISSYSTGCLNLLAQPAPNLDLIRQAIEKTGEQAQRAGHIIRGIRDFVQRKEPNLRPCQLDTLIDNVLALLDVELRHAGVRIKRQQHPLPDIPVDRVMIEQVLFNLVRNAVDAMTDTPREIRSMTLDVHEQDGMVECRIIDRGCGLNQMQKEQLFKPFYTTKQHGLGMGLNICRSIIEYHHGRLWVEDNPEGGCQFIFVLPVDAGTDTGPHA